MSELRGNRPPSKHKEVERQRAARQKKIRYALTEGQRFDKVGNAGLSNITWSSNEDNPASPNFVPLEDRSELSKAVFWSNANKKKPHPATGVFD